MSAPSLCVIGAGAIGASVAYHLAASGRRNVVLLDRSDAPGTGSTGAATGGFRAQFATPVNVRLSLLSRSKLLRFHEETGVDPGYLPAGYLWIARARAELEALRGALEVQRGGGLSEAREVSTEEIAKLNPWLRPDGILGGTFSPTDGFIRPRDILEGYLRGAARLGARIGWSTEVSAMTRRPDGGILAVTTSRGEIQVEAVVNAAGAWAASVAAMAGVDLPVAPLRRQVAATVPTDVLPPSTPMTIDVGDGFHFRARDGRVLFLLPTPGVPGRPYDVTVDPSWIDRVTEIARERVPALGGIAVDRAASWAGLYEMTPDKHAIVGAAEKCPNLYLVNGSSGHGVMHAPALGQILAEMIAGERTAIDVSALRPSRFREGAAVEAPELL
ncbi:MAG TPA: FAD-binding oxidoreductase [Candidatus Eisenbacteria bacterium]|nr:FAD-binding oxidoreductase [Candidatus Eisenbacteria bacterium]